MCNCTSILLWLVAPAAAQDCDSTIDTFNSLSGERNAIIQDNKNNSLIEYCANIAKLIPITHKMISALEQSMMCGPVTNADQLTRLKFSVAHNADELVRCRKRIADEGNKPEASSPEGREMGAVENCVHAVVANPNAGGGWIEYRWSNTCNFKICFQFDDCTSDVSTTPISRVCKPRPWHLQARASELKSIFKGELNVRSQRRC